MNDAVVKSMTSLKTRNSYHLKNQQIAYIPTVEDDQIDYMCQDYLIDGQRHIVKQAFRKDPSDENSRLAFEVCFKLRYLKHKFMEPRKANKYITGIWKMQDLVHDNVIFPFALFINGRFIPWECMSIAIGKENYYLLSNNGEWGQEFDDILKNVQFAQIVSLPDHFKYESGVKDINVNDYALSFNADGYYNGIYADETLGNNESFYRFYTDLNSNHILYKRYDRNSNLQYLADPVEFDNINMRKVQITKENVLLFKNGLLGSGTRSNIVKAYDSNHKDETTKKVTPCLEFLTEDVELEKNLEIHIDSNMITILHERNIPHETKKGEVEYTVFINYHNSDNVNNISIPDSDCYKELVRNLSKEMQHQGKLPIIYPAYQTSLQDNFGNDDKPMTTIWDEKTNKLVSYQQNLYNLIYDILSYNSSLLNDALLSTSNLDIERHDGAWLKSITGDDGIAVIPRSHNLMCDEHILILVNGELYKLYYACTEYANKYNIPVQDINDDDIIEFLRFKNVNNLTGSLVVNKDDKYFNYSTDVINEDMILFSTETDQDYFDFPADGLQHFPVEYKILKDDKGYTKIELKNEFYYGKKLTVAYKNRYKQFTFILKGTTDKYTVNLGDKFMYCNDYAKFLVFYNGRKLGSDQYRLTLPVRPTTPFSTFDIYLTLPIVDGDRLDVIYVPSLMKDIYMEYTLDSNGDIIIDKELLNYDVSRDLFMVWINGCKIPKDYIRDINTNQIAITNNFKSINTVCVTQYIPEIDDITQVIKHILGNSKDSFAITWDMALDDYLKEEKDADLHKFLGINVNEFDTSEESLYENAVPIKSIMYELIREKYVMNPRVDITEPFMYDYQDVDKTAIEGRDSDDNAILPVADSNRQDNLDNVDREWP